MNWLRYEDRLHLTPYWRSAVEVGDRRFGFTRPDHQFHARMRLLYLLSPKLFIGVGGAYFSGPADTARAVDDLPTAEWRAHQEISLRNARKRWATHYQLRLEERFFQENRENGVGSGFNYRIRYRIEFSYAVIQKLPQLAGTLRIKAGSELMLNAGKRIINNVFNQARLQAGLHYQIGKALSADALYLKILHLRDAGDQFWNRDVLRVGLLHEWRLKPALKPRKKEWLRIHQGAVMPEDNQW